MKLSKLVFLIIPFLISSCGTNSGDVSEGEESSLSEDVALTFSMKIGKKSYSLSKYEVEKDTYVSEYAYVDNKEEIKFSANNTDISVFPDINADKNNITEAFPSNNAYSSIHVKNGGGFIYATLKINKDTDTYSFRISEPKLYDSTVSNAGSTIYVVGTTNDWTRVSNNKMKAISLLDVAKVDMKLADTLIEKRIDYVYTATYSFATKGSYTSKYLDENGNVQTLNSGYVYKILVGEYGWTPSAQYHVEALDNYTWVGPFVDFGTDPNGFDYETDMVCLGGDGTYKVFFAKYKQGSTLEKPGYAVALYKVS